MYLSNIDSTLNNVNDGEEYQSTLECMYSVGIDAKMQQQVFSLLSGILHLGNVLFEEDDGEGQVQGVSNDTIAPFQAAAKHLGVDEKQLLFALTKQNMYVNGQTIVKTQTQVQVLLLYILG
jgi:myosin heavy subunit